MILLALLLRSCDKEKQSAKDYISLNNWLNSSTTKVSELEAENVYLEMNSRDAFIAMGGLQGDKLELQKLLKEEKRINQALIHRLNVKLKVKEGGVTVSRIDTLDSFLYPTYNKVFSDQWYKADVSMSKDSASLDLELNAKITYTYSWKRDKGLFGLKTPIVKATLDNPYFSTEDIESVTIKEKPPRFSWGVTGGIGISTELKPVIGVIIGPSIRIRDF